jgi:L-asparagine oxygenase
MLERPRGFHKALTSQLKPCHNTIARSRGTVISVGNTTSGDTAFSRVVERGWSLLEYRGDLVEFGSRLGQPVPARRGEGSVSLLRVQMPEQGHANSLTSRYGPGQFPYHTDGAHFRVVPRYLLLRLAAGSTSERATEVFDLLSALDADDWALLRSEQWKFAAGRGAFLSPILSRTGLRFDASIMRPAIPSRRLAADLVERKIALAQPASIDWVKGVVAIIDNHRMLHARSLGTGMAETRVLERVLVEER